MSAGSLLVDIGLSIARLQSDMGKATRLFASGMKQMAGDVSFLKNSLVSLVSVGSLAALAKSAMDLGGQFTDMASKSGAAASDLMALSYPAKMVGVEVEEVGNAFRFMQKNIAAAENETSDAAMAFGILGIKLSELKGKDPTQQFLRIAEAFSRLEKDENRTAIGLEIFGKGFATIAPLVGQGEAAIRKAMEAAKEMGIALSEKEIKTLDDYGDAYDRNAMKIKSWAARAVIELGSWYDWMFNYNKLTIRQTEQLSAAWEKVLIKVGLYNPSIKTGKIADILVENPDKVRARNLEAEKKAAAEKKKMEEEYQKIHAKTLADEGKLVHDILADEMGISQDYYDTQTKLRMDDFKEWKGIEEEIVKLDAASWEERGKAAHEALVEEMGYGAEIAKPYLFEDAMKAAEAYGNVGLAIQTMNSDLGATQATLEQNQSWIALYQQAWTDANLAIADSMHSLYSGMQNWISSSLQGLIEGTMQVQDVLKGLGKMMLQIITEYVAKWLVSRLFMSAMEKVFAMEAIVTATTTAGIIATAWAPAAIAASIATLGVAAEEGLAAYLGAVAMGTAITSGIKMSSLVSPEGWTYGGAGAATGAAFASGTNYVPLTMPALVHEGERILTPEQNKDFTEFIGGKGGRGAGQTIVLEMDGEVLARWFNKANRSGVLRLVPA